MSVPHLEGVPGAERLGHFLERMRDSGLGRLDGMRWILSDGSDAAGALSKVREHVKIGPLTQFT
jgi:hypothetical protein